MTSRRNESKRTVDINANSALVFAFWRISDTLQIAKVAKVSFFNPHAMEKRGGAFGAS